MSFFSSIPTWGWFDIFFNFVVLVALCGESHWGLKLLIPNSSKGATSVKWRREILKKKFEFLLIAGIAGEVCCLPFSLYESANANRAASGAMVYAANSSSNSVQVLAQVAGLNKEAADARVIAGNAENDAGQANERAANTESNNLVLQKELQPRTITMQDVTNFMFLTQKVSKNFPIKICIGRSDAETETYAFQIRQMLTQAKFKTDSSAGLFGYTRFPDFVEVMPIGIKRQDASIFFVTADTNWVGSSPFSVSVESSKYGTALKSTKNTPLEIYQDIQFAFSQINIPTTYFVDTNSEMVKPGEYAFFISTKN